jgi:hypothetical protein
MENPKNHQVITFDQYCKHIKDTCDKAENNDNNVPAQEMIYNSTDRLQDKLADELDRNDRMALYFMGFTSESTPYATQVRTYSSLFPGFGPNVDHIVYPWHAEKSFYGCGDAMKTFWNRMVSKESCKFMTTYRKALENSFDDANELFLNFEKHRIEYSPELNFVGYSLGTQFIFNLLTKLQLANFGHKENGHRNYTVNNVVLMAGVLSSSWLYSKLADFFGTNGILKGNIVIVQSKNDHVLKDLVEGLRVNSADRDFDGIEEANNDPVGRCNFKIEDAARVVQRSNHSNFKDMELKEIIDYLKKRIFIVDCSQLTNTKGKMVKLHHTAYMEPENFDAITQKVIPHLNKFD